MEEKEENSTGHGSKSCLVTSFSKKKISHRNREIYLTWLNNYWKHNCLSKKKLLEAKLFWLSIISISFPFVHFPFLIESNAKRLKHFATSFVLFFFYMQIWFSSITSGLGTPFSLNWYFHLAKEIKYVSCNP